MMKVIEIADMLGVSKVTIYKKMSKFKKEIKPYIVKDKNITYIKDEGIEIIKSDIAKQSYESSISENKNLLDEISVLKESCFEKEKKLDDIESDYIRFLLKSIEERQKDIEVKKDIILKLKDIINNNKKRISCVEEGNKECI